MKVKDLINALKKCNQNSNVIFYYLNDYDLINCQYETLLDVEDNRVELTITNSKQFLMQSKKQNTKSFGSRT